MFCVNVPVLSLHTIDVLPNVSTAGNLLTIALCFTIFCVDNANTIVTTVANPSGIAATANAIAVLKDSNNPSKPPKNSIPNTTIQTPIHNIPIVFPISSNLI